MKENKYMVQKKKKMINKCRKEKLRKIINKY